MKQGAKVLIWTIIVAALVTISALMHLEVPAKKGILKLTQQELQWLETHANTIRIAPLPDSPPIDFIDQNGIHQGLSADYIREIEHQLGIQFIQINCRSWKEIIEKLHAREVDMVASVQNTPERHSFLRFTEPYLCIPNEIITPSCQEENLTLATMGKMTIAVVDQSATHDFLIKTHPEYTLIPVTNAAAGLQMVSLKEADAMVADLGVASYYIDKLVINNLRVAGNVNYPWELCLASRKDWPLLNSILNKVLANINPIQRRLIKQRWITLHDPIHIPREHYLKTIGILLILTLLVIGLIMLRNRNLRNQVTHHSNELGRVRQSHALATRALDESEARFRVMVESSTDIIWEIDLEGQVLYISPRVEDVLGFTPNELIGRSFLSLMIHNDSARTMEMLRTSTIHTTMDCEVNTYIHKQGDRVILESSGMAFANSKGKLVGFRGISHDITKRIANENALRRSEERFRNLVETTSDWIWEVDTEGNYQYSSPQASELLGHSVDELLGKHFTSHMSPQEAESVTALFKEVVKEGAPIHSLVNTNCHKDGHTVVIETSAVPYYDKDWNIQGYRGIGRNITYRKQAEDELRQLRALLSNTIDSMPSILIGVDAEGTVIQWNRQAEKLTGLLPFDAVGAPLRTVFPELAKEMIKVERAMRERRPQKEERIVIQDGERTRYNDITVYPLLNGEAEGAVIRVDDVTDRVMIEDSIRNIVEGVAAVGHRFFNSMVDQLVKTLDADFAYITEFQDRSHETMRTIAASKGGETVDNFEYQLACTPCESVLNGDTFVYFEHVTEQFPNAPWLNELAINSYIGIPLVDSEKNALGVMVALYKDPLDKTEFATSIMQVFAGRTSAELERLQATKELISARNLLENIINATPSTIIAVNAESQVMQWNQQAEELSGINASKAQGQPLNQVFPDLGNEMNAILKSINSLEVQRHQRIYCTIKDKLHIVDITIFPITTNGSDGAVIRLDDVTDRVRIEEMMIQSEKMMSVGGLAAGMAHEINNPLAGILQNLQVMRNRVTHETERNTSAARNAGTSLQAIQTYMENRGLMNMMDSIYEAGRRAAKIVDNMLSFSRKDEAHFAPNDLKEIIERSLELASNDYNLKKHFDFRHIQIIREIESIEPIPCEGSQIQQVILNLLSNSAQAMAEYPNERDNPQISIRLKDESGMVLIEVEDNGPGMDAETRKRAFEPFFTTKGVGHGTGLGLSVSYFIITENHGGTMSVSSSPGKGACFSIRIPHEHRTERWGLRL